ncbi:MAG: hypothetical protein ACNS63_11005 [Candidatus Nitrospinota bacterium M3_3B_026]
MKSPGKRPAFSGLISAVFAAAAVFVFGITTWNVLKSGGEPVWAVFYGLLYGGITFLVGVFISYLETPGGKDNGG